MMGMVRTIWNRYRAIKAADKITRFLLPAFVHFFSPEGKLDKKMQTDEFLLSYMYGVFMFTVHGCGITDDMQKGFTLLKCYDKFFPGEAKQVVDLCNARVEARDKQFMDGVARGLKEIAEVAESKGQSALPSLRKHLVHQYV